MEFDQAADVIANARANNVTLGALPLDYRPETNEEAYGLHARVCTRLEGLGYGERSGYKIGCTTRVMQDFLNIKHPCAGGIMADTIYQHSVERRLDDYRQVGVECEIAVRLGSDIVVGKDEILSDGDIAQAVKSCMAAIEIVDNRYDDYTTIGTPTLIADGFFGAGCVLGDEITHWRDLDLATLAGRVFINNDVVGTGTGAAILDHPLNALSWLAHHLAQYGQSLKAGELVMLGSIVQTQWVNMESTVVAEIDGLGRAEASFR